jgi:Fe-S cluster assembly scaffold protein SufB
MDMKNAENVKSASYVQINHEIRSIFAREGVILLSSPEAYATLEWTRNYFNQKPIEGYFIWVKKRVEHPISTCFTISSPKAYQNPTNLVVVEKDIATEIYSICNAAKPILNAEHKGYSKVILKENSTLKMKHFHNWGKNDYVLSSIEFILEKGAKLSSFYKCINPPKKFKIESKTSLDNESSADFETAVLAKNGEIEMFDSLFLNGEKSSGMIKLRMISDENSKISSHSKIVAKGGGKGHIDCMGLLLSESSFINSTPELVNANKNAVLTHEAAIGKISEEELNYLRSRGLSKDEAVNLIVTGFLGEVPV